MLQSMISASITVYMPKYSCTWIPFTYADIFPLIELRIRSPNATINFVPDPMIPWDLSTTGLLANNFRFVKSACRGLERLIQC